MLDNISIYIDSGLFLDYIGTDVTLIKKEGQAVKPKGISGGSLLAREVMCLTPAYVAEGVCCSGAQSVDRH
jgi:hypothetical protein